MSHQKDQDQAQQYPGMELAEVAFRGDMEISVLAAELRRQGGAS